MVEGSRLPPFKKVTELMDRAGISYPAPAGTLTGVQFSSNSGTTGLLNNSISFNAAALK
jgi:hypothetical protein